MRNRRVRSEREWPRLLAGPEPPPSTLSPFGPWRSLVSALDWGSRGREFKSPRPDRIEKGGRMSGSEPESPAGAGPRSQGPAGEPPVLQGPSDAEQASLNRIATAPNLLSSLRILLIPMFVALLLHH